MQLYSLCLSSRSCENTAVLNHSDVSSSLTDRQKLNLRHFWLRSSFTFAAGDHTESDLYRNQSRPHSDVLRRESYWGLCSQSECVCVCVSVWVSASECVYLCEWVCVSVCVCICVSECVYLCECVCVCVYLCEWVCVSVCVCVSVWVCICVSECVYLCEWVSVCLCLCLCVCVCVCVCVNTPWRSLRAWALDHL